MVRESALPLLLLLVRMYMRHSSCGSFVEMKLIRCWLRSKKTLVRIQCVLGHFTTFAHPSKQASEEQWSAGQEKERLDEDSKTDMGTFFCAESVVAEDGVWTRGEGNGPSSCLLPQSYVEGDGSAEDLSFAGASTSDNGAGASLSGSRVVSPARAAGWAG